MAGSGPGSTAPATTAPATTAPAPGAARLAHPATDDVRDLRGVRVLLATDTWAPQVNGVVRTLERLADALVARGAAVHVLAPAAASADADADADADAAPPGDVVPDAADREGCGHAAAAPPMPGAPQAPTVTRWPSAAFWAYPELRLAAPRSGRAAAVLRAFRPTLVHVATPFGIGLAARRAARQAGVPLVSSYHTSFSAYAAHYGLGALAAPGWRFLRWFHDGGRRTYVPTDAVAREVAAHGFARLAVWSRGVDADRFHPRRRSVACRAAWGARDDDVVVAYVGRLAREKGLDLLLAALARLHGGQEAAAGRRIVPVFVGDGPHEGACRAAAPPGTVFTGRLTGDRLAEAYASADVFVFPSRTDTFGNVLLEAMASGLAVCAVEAAATRELVAPGGIGTLAPATPDALAAAVAALAADPAGRTARGAAARAAAAARGWPAVFDALFADYLRVGARGGR